MESRNAVIESASLSTADYGCLSSFIHLNFGDSSGQGFGGYSLYSPAHKRDVAGYWIWRVLQIAGVSEWKDLPGKTVRVKHTWNKVHSIGHIVKDDWFTPEVDLKDK